MAEGIDQAHGKISRSVIVKLDLVTEPYKEPSKTQIAGSYPQSLIQ